MTMEKTTVNEDEILIVYGHLDRVAVLQSISSDLPRA